MALNAIETHGLSKSFPNRRTHQVVEAVRGVDLAVGKGEIFGFLGPNGAGKTTCQRMLTTLLPIGGGSAHVMGINVAERSSKVRERIGYVSQMGGADTHATGLENLMMAGRLYGLSVADTRTRITSLASLLDLGEILDRFVSTYSGGQKRRLEIGLAIVHRPDVLFMDEPSTGLDPQNRANLWTHIRSLGDEGMTVFLTTHYLDEADQLAGQVAIMDRGLIVAEGNPTDLKREISGDSVVITMGSEQDAQIALSALSDVAVIHDASQNGHSLLLYVADGAGSLPIIFDRLEPTGVRVESVSVSSPSLDDVFLKKTGRSLRDTGKEVE